MTNANAIADHWDRGDVYGLIVSALNKMSKPLVGLTVEDLAPVDHFHARGFPATVELADRLPIKAHQHILDACRKRDGNAASDAMEGHVTGLENLVRERYQHLLKHATSVVARPGRSIA